MMMDIYQLQRTNKPVCWNCSDSGECEAGGMIKGPCPICTKISEIDPVKFDKRKKIYKEALGNFRSKFPELSKAEAEELFEIEYNKLDK